MAAFQGFRQTTKLETGNGLRLDPRLLLSSRLTQLTQGELESAIQEELNENPALERLVDSVDVLTDDMIMRSVAPNELRPSSEDQEFRRSLPQDGNDTEWLDFAGSVTSLTDHLAAQLLSSLPKELEALGLYVVESLDNKGYLSMPAEEIALETGHSYEEVEGIIAKLQKCHPAGVGANDVRECLMLQLQDAVSVEQRLARAILRSYMDEFLNRKSMRIARKFKVMPEVVEAAFGEILALDPFPGESFAPSASEGRGAVVTPDLVFHYAESGWTVEVTGADPSHFAINRSYLKRFRELKGMSKAPKDEKSHVTEHVQRAENFIGSLEQRRQTLTKVAESLLRHQPGFIQTGSYDFLTPLTRTQIAKEVGLHESTVSRATADKFVQIANGEVVPFEVFFKPALRIQKMIEEILSNEDADRPMSDEQITLRLAQRGVFVARRTVNKYRDKTKLLSSRKRRSA